MADEPSLGELGRLIQALREDNREDFAEIRRRFDRVVPMDVYTVEKAKTTEDINDLKSEVAGIRQQREKDAERVTQTRRWIIAAVIIPLIGLILPLLLSMRGAS